MSGPLSPELRKRLSLAIGVVVAFAIGLSSALVGFAAPAPPTIEGALIVAAMTAGYLIADRYFAARPAQCEDLCAGPSGADAKRGAAGGETKPP